MRIRIVSTFPGKHTVQVVSKRLGKLTVHRHLGTYSSNQEKQNLLKAAQKYIKNQTGQESLFDPPEYLRPENVIITQSRPMFLYRLLDRIYQKLGFDKCGDSLIRDLILARIYKPSSKRETREILKDLFGLNYSLATVYRHLKRAIDGGLKQRFQTALVSFAQKELNDSLRLVFYDVTTLSFDSQTKAGLKDFGFSKDHRQSDVQIVVGLVVNKQGFPLYFDVFNGKTFEGKTFLSVVENVCGIFGNPNLVVVADAAMISRGNVEELDRRNIGFIVGARLANLPVKLQDRISGAVSGRDAKTTVANHLGHRLICQYLLHRAAKDRSDREKQLKKAEKALSSQSRISRRFRFLQVVEGKYALNRDLLAKAEKLEGIKGYLTNTNLGEEDVIERYRDLWRIEKAFRITKSDLEARPIFVHLDKTITCHLVIVFAGLAICRYLEIQTGLSIQKILKVAEKVLTHKVTIAQTEETGFVETTIANQELKEKIELLNSLGH